jgi:hypothetical protein
MMMAKLYKWKASATPTGQYRSFARRAWPTASYGADRDERIAAQILCRDDYTPHSARNGIHSPLTVQVADYSVATGFKWCAMKETFTTLDAAKQAFEALLMKNPQLMAPKRIEK